MTQTSQCGGRGTEIDKVIVTKQVMTSVIIDLFIINIFEIVILIFLWVR